MKLTTILLFLSVFAAYASKTYSQYTRLSLDLKDVPVKEVLTSIENNSEFFFLYSSKMIDVSRKVNIHVDNKTIDEVLDKIFLSSNIKYIVEDRQILLVNEESNVTLSEQQNRITGTVTNNNGEPLVGVNVVVKGTTVGAITDMEGKYTINIPDGATTLMFSFIGMEPQEIGIGTSKQIDVVLNESAVDLSEVVVVGYGTQKKINLTGAVTQINATELQDRSISNISQALQGAIPNLNITIGSGKPGTSGTLNIRGNTSITGTGTPLVLIDGIPGEIDRVNVRDIESVTILKDASASAIYGARAAFGVILVTTKNGTTGSPTISYNNSFGWATDATNTDFITTAYDNIRINEESYYNALGRKWTGYTEEDYNEIYLRRNDKTEVPERPWVMIKPDKNGRDVYKYYANFDWYNWFYSKWRPKQEHNLSIMGSSEKIKYYLSGGLKDEQGIMKQNPDKYRRYNLNTKLDIEILPWLEISNNSRLFNSSYRYFGKEGGMFPTVYNNLSTNQIYMMTPANVPTNPDGTGTYLMDNGTYAIGYGAHLAQMNKKLTGNNVINDFTTTFEAKIKILEGLSLTGNYTFNLESTQDMYRAVRLQYSLYPGVVQQVPRAEWDRDMLKETTGNNKYNIINIYGNFEKTFNSHNVKLTAGINREERIFKSVYAEGQELLSESINDLNLVTGEKQVAGGASEWALSGIFYRANYDYDGKYLFEASGRYDGTSRFKKGDRFGFFPSFSVGWRISQENFFQPIQNYINNLKLRFSYGSLGNQQVATYAYIASMSATNMSYVIDGQRLRSVSIPDPISASLTWEKTISKNLGLDLDILQNRMSIVFDAYIRDTKGMLVKGMTLPSVFGATEPRENAADLRTKGFELTINWKDSFDMFNSSFNYNIGVVLSDYTAKITKFDNPSRVLSDYYVGQELGEIWGFIYDGYFKTTEEAQAYPVDQNLINRRRVQAPTTDLRMLQAGDIKIIDQDGDNQINFGAGTVDDPGDRKKIGNAQPRYSFGIPIGISWKGIDLNILFQGIGRQNYYPDLENQRFWNSYARPYGTFLPIDFESKIWRPENPDAYFPRMIGYIAQNSELRYENNKYLQDLAYIKLRTLVLGYSLPSRLANSLKINNLRIYFSGENLFTWTKFETDYIDPEEVMWDKTGRTYPMGKIYSFGLEIKL